jgi:MINDY deubiquitinase
VSTHLSCRPSSSCLSSGPTNFNHPSAWRGRRHRPPLSQRIGLSTAACLATSRANLTRNLADAVTLLPKLATGIDVNVRFHDIRGFEFTDEVAIFDLLDTSLVHGWLVDPQVRGCQMWTKIFSCSAC